MSNRTGRPGRPAKVTLDDVVRAALKIGLEQATIRSVADELGMSVPGLYHHVRTREQLLELVSEWWLGQLLSTVKADESFEALLRRYARKLFEMTTEHPEMIDRVRKGRGMATIFHLVPYLAQIVDHGVKCGFTAQEAFDVLTIATGSALGAAVIDASTRAFLATDETPPGGLDSTEYSQLIQGSLADASLTIEATFAGLRAQYGERFGSSPSDA